MEAPKQDAAEAESVAAATDGLFARRATRGHTVNILIAVALGAIAWSSWPTPTRQVTRRATEFVEALQRHDFAAAHELLPPAVRQQLPAKAWAAQLPANLPKGEVTAVVVDPGGDNAVVTVADPQAKAMNWKKVDHAWYCDCAQLR